MKIHDTVCAQVAAVLAERFAECEPFTSVDVARELPWVGSASPTDVNHTSRVSAALCYFARNGVVLRFGRQGRMNVFVTDASLLAQYCPKVRHVELGCERPSRRRNSAVERENAHLRAVLREMIQRLQEALEE